MRLEMDIALELGIVNDANFFSIEPFEKMMIMIAYF